MEADSLRTWSQAGNLCQAVKAEGWTGLRTSATAFTGSGGERNVLFIGVFVGVQRAHERQEEGRERSRSLLPRRSVSKN